MSDGSTTAAPRDTGRALRAAAVGFAGTVAVTSIVAIRDNVEGRPFGVRVPLSVRAGILTGWGAGIAAPWPMAVAVAVAASRTRRNSRSPWPGRTCAGLGLAGIAGLLIEPNTYRPREWSRATRASVVMDFSAKVALLLAGILQSCTIGRVDESSDPSCNVNGSTLTGGSLMTTQDRRRRRRPR
jgi:hypothetical protein